MKSKIKEVVGVIKGMHGSSNMIQIELEQYDIKNEDIWLKISRFSQSHPIRIVWGGVRGIN